MKGVLGNVGVRPSGSDQINGRFKTQAVLAKPFVPDEHTRKHCRIGAQGNNCEAGRGTGRNIKVVGKNALIQSGVLINQDSHSLILSQGLKDLAEGILPADDFVSG
jgi:hypothetical protein